MSTPECHFDILMSEQLLDRGQINTCHDEVRREGMPDIMEMEVPDACFSAGCRKAFPRLIKVLARGKIIEYDILSALCHFGLSAILGFQKDPDKRE